MKAVVKWAGPKSAWAGKLSLGQIYLVFFLENYEMGIGLHSIGPKSFWLYTNGPNDDGLNSMKG